MKKVRLSIKSRFSEMRRNGIIVNLFGLLPLLWSVLLVGIFVWGICVSLANPGWYLDNPTALVVKDFTVSNFIDAFSHIRLQVSDVIKGIRDVNYFEMILNSLWFSLGATFMKIASTIFFAYAVAHFEFPGRKLLYGFVVLQMMLPLYGQTSANYILLSRLGLVDTPLFLLAQGAGHGMYFLISYNYFRNIDSGYAEAAKIDGAGEFTIFGRIMLPLARPIIVALGVMTFIACWNDYATVILYLPSHPTLASGLFRIRSLAFNLGLQTPQYFAAIFISVVPVAILFLIFNKQIMSNMTIGGIKG